MASASSAPGGADAPRGSASYGDNGAEDVAYDPGHCACVVAARDVVSADPATLFEHIADPSRQIAWDGNDNLDHAAAEQRITAVGDVFRTRLTNGQTRENHVVEFVEGELIAWMPADVGAEPAGHLWRWSIASRAEGRAEVTHTYDWSRLVDERRLAKARATTADQLAASVARLKQLCEAQDGTGARPDGG